MPGLGETPGFRVRTKLTGRSGRLFVVTAAIKGQLSPCHAGEFAPNREKVTHLVTSPPRSSLGKQPKTSQGERKPSATGDASG